MILKKILFWVIFIVYGLLCFYQEQIVKTNRYSLPFPVPSVVQKPILGYLRQIGGEMHFIKTSVFLGGAGVRNLTYTQSDSLSENFKVMSELHPHFIDTYFLCQSTLPYLGAEKAQETNAILENGVSALPDYWVLPFFIGFNHFFFLDEKVKAAKHLLKASKLPGAQSWLGHLASVLAAEGGDILIGLNWLRAMRETEEDPSMKERLSKDIAKFEQALKVEKAIFTFREKYRMEPESLNLLVPEFLPALPDFGKDFVLKWEPPFLRLKRTKKQKISDQ